MNKWFVASDIHGFFTVFRNELTKKGFDINNPEHKVIICGDLLDRGSEAVPLFEFVKDLHGQGRLIYVRGNHEDLLFDCVRDIVCCGVPGLHHKSNGTVDTICQFCNEGQWIVYDPSKKRDILDAMRPVLKFFEDNCVDYAEVGDYVFVHGWIPVYEGLDDFRKATSEDWTRARWDNGMEMWKNPHCRLEGKTIVCGHWHCSWGWSHLRLERKEFPSKARDGWESSFEPFKDDGIIAIDACTAYSGLCNVIVVDDNGEGDENHGGTQ